MLDCPLPDLHPDIEEITVCPDLEGNGVFILDVTATAKFTFISTKSPITLHLPKQVASVRVLNKREPHTACRYVEISVKPGEQLAGVGSDGKLCACMVADEALMKMCTKSVGNERSKHTEGRGGRGGGRGRREERD